MSQFENFFSENKLRIPLSAYAAQIIESDCLSFSKKKTTLINTIILNYYPQAECSISLRLEDYKKELSGYFSKSDAQKNLPIINKILSGRKDELSNRYIKRMPADVNWQITLNKKVIELLTIDPYSQEELYYKDRPGRFIQALIEEYARQPFYVREEIIFKQVLDTIRSAISGHNLLSIINTNGKHIAIKPYQIASDPLSMYHYIVGYSSSPSTLLKENKPTYKDHPLSIRLSRIVDAEIKYLHPGDISPQEEFQIKKELSEKGVQFVSGDTSTIQIWLSDYGIKKYNTQIHLRPQGTKDENDEHIYNFECTEAQILYYFIGFGRDAKVLSPVSLADKFKNIYKNAAEIYE